MRKYIVFSIVSGLLFGGCQGIAHHLKFQKPQPAAERKASDQVPVARETVSGPLTLYEAMARAVRYNLSGEVEKMERALDRADTAASDYDSLVDLVRAAGYGYPGPAVDSGTRRFSSGEGLPVTDGRRADMPTVWNMLDLGVLHAVRREGIQSMPETEGIRRKAVRNILYKTRGLYYRAAGAEALTAEVGRLLNQAREALQMTRETNRQNPSPSREALETQRELIEQIRWLRGWMEELSSARIDLCEWMGVGPGSDFKLVEPAWNQPIVPILKKTAADLEKLALAHRWEARRNGMPGDAGVAQTREAMLRLQPSLDFHGQGAGGGEPWAAGQNWREMGLRLMPGLIMSASAVSSSRQTRGVESNGPGRLAVNAAILTQVHLARQRFRLALEDYRLSNLLDDVNMQLQTQADGGPPPGRAGLSVIRRSRDLLQARMVHYLAFTELENAAFRLYNTMGIDSLPPEEGTLGVASMAKYLDRSMNRWKNSFNSAQILYSPPDRDIAEEYRDSTRETAPERRRSATPAPSSSSAPITAAPIDQGIPVIEAAAAEREGRRPVKEVEVYRDVVSIHDSPDSNAPVKGRGLIGEKYRLAGWTPDGWLKIEMMDGSFGWIPTKFIRPVDEPVSAADETAREEETGAGSNMKLISTTTRADVRSGPGFHQEIKYVEAEGVRHNVQAVSGAWFRIRARDGSEGWVHESVVKVLAEK